MALKERMQWKQAEKETISDFVRSAFDEVAENPCPVDQLKAFSDRLRRTSCGECVICREGILQLYTLSDTITQGIGRDGDIDVLREISADMVIGSGCDYGKEAGKYAQDMVVKGQEQFEKHIKRKRCDALVCKKFIYYYAAPDKCIGCHQCASVCEPHAIAGSEGMIHVVDPAVCSRCGACIAVCEAGAIKKPVRP
jgi:NADH-quinone oxidoreductase subunit F